MGLCGCCVSCCVCAIVGPLVAIGVLLALVPSGYLTYEYYLKPWGEDLLAEYGDSIAAAMASASANPNADTGDFGSLLNISVCAKCPGVNTAFPITSETHPSYGSFQVSMMNDGGQITTSLTTAGVVIGGAGSLVLALLGVFAGAGGGGAGSAAAASSSTASNGCGVFEMATMISQAQFMTMLGALQLEGAPVFFLEFCRKLAWTNLQIFPEEDGASTWSSDQNPSTEGGGRARRLLSWDTDAAANSKGVERYALLVGVTPDHLFYYTCVALAIVLGVILVVYITLRLVMRSCQSASASTLDHRVIWVYLQLFVFVQYIISMTACFQIYYTLSTHGSTGDLGLAIVILAVTCIGLLVFAILKVARHRKEIEAVGTPAFDANTPFHLRYSVFYQDYTANMVYFFAAKLLLDVASGAVIGTVQNVMIQIGILVGLNVLFLIVLIWCHPYIVPLFYYVGVIAGYLRVVLLLLTLLNAYPDVFPQNVRDFAAVLTIAANGVLLACILVRQLYVLVVAIITWAKNRNKHDDSMPLPYEDGAHRSEAGMNMQEPFSPIKSISTTAGDTAWPRKSGQSMPTTGLLANEPSSPEDHITSPTSAPAYFEINNKRFSLTGSRPSAMEDASSSSKRSSGSSGSRSRRSRYTTREHRRKKKPSEYEAVSDEQLPDWARI